MLIDSQGSLDRDGLSRQVPFMGLGAELGVEGSRQGRGVHWLSPKHQVQMPKACF